MKSGKPLVLVVSRRGTVEHDGAMERGAVKRRPAVEHDRVEHGSELERGRSVAPCATVQRGKASPPARERTHLRLVAANGVSLSRAAAAGGRRAAAPAQGLPERRRPRSLSRPFGQRVVLAAHEVAVLALALLSGLRPRA